MTDDAAGFASSGRLWWRGFLTDDALAVLDNATDLQGRPGTRAVIDPKVSAVLGPHSSLGRRLAGLLPASPSGAIPVRLVGFDKTAQANWGVPWHQDRVITVAERHDLPGYTNWSRKSDQWHCEPPAK